MTAGSPPWLWFPDPGMLLVQRPADVTGPLLVRVPQGATLGALGARQSRLLVVLPPDAQEVILWSDTRKEPVRRHRLRPDLCAQVTTVDGAMHARAPNGDTLRAQEWAGGAWTELTLGADGAVPLASLRQDAVVVLSVLHGDELGPAASHVPPATRPTVWLRMDPPEGERRHVTPTVIAVPGCESLRVVWRRMTGQDVVSELKGPGISYPNIVTGEHLAVLDAAGPLALAWEGSPRRPPHLPTRSDGAVRYQLDDLYADSSWTPSRVASAASAAVVAGTLEAILRRFPALARSLSPSGVRAWLADPGLAARLARMPVPLIEQFIRFVGSAPNLLPAPMAYDNAALLNLFLRAPQLFATLQDLPGLSRLPDFAAVVANLPSGPLDAPQLLALTSADPDGTEEWLRGQGDSVVRLWVDLVEQDATPTEIERLTRTLRLAFERTELRAIRELVSQLEPLSDTVDVDAVAARLHSGPVCVRVEECRSALRVLADGGARAADVERVLRTHRALDVQIREAVREAVGRHAEIKVELDAPLPILVASLERAERDLAAQLPAGVVLPAAALRIDALLQAAETTRELRQARAAIRAALARLTPALRGRLPADPDPIDLARLLAGLWIEQDERSSRLSILFPGAPPADAEACCHALAERERLIFEAEARASVEAARAATEVAAREELERDFARELASILEVGKPPLRSLAWLDAFGPGGLLAHAQRAAEEGDLPAARSFLEDARAAMSSGPAAYRLDLVELLYERISTVGPVPELACPAADALQWLSDALAAARVALPQGFPAARVSPLAATGAVRLRNRLSELGLLPAPLPHYEVRSCPT